MPNISDLNGRALEYMLVAKLEDAFDIQLTERAHADQQRDIGKPNLIQSSVKQRFEHSVDLIVDWLSSKIDTSVSLVVDRLPDAQARLGDVTDIRITNRYCELNLSLKHNHYALKHQRPPRLCEQMGFAPDSEENSIYRSQYRTILDNFLTAADRLLPQASLFSELKAVEPKFVYVHLYAPICSLADTTYKKYQNQQLCAEALFNFLVGNTGFYKIVVSDKKTEVFDFQNTKLPTSFFSSFDPERSNYVSLQFDNGWDLSLRLHTASKRITNDVSLKFDTQSAGHLPITKEEL